MSDETDDIRKNLEKIELSQQDGDRIIYFESKEEMDDYLICKSNMIELYKKVSNR
jgi:hypothetical protein